MRAAICGWERLIEIGDREGGLGGSGQVGTHPGLDPGAGWGIAAGRDPARGEAGERDHGGGRSVGESDQVSRATMRPILQTGQLKQVLGVGSRNSGKGLGWRSGLPLLDQVQEILPELRLAQLIGGRT